MEVGKESASFDSGDFDTDSAFTFGKTSSGDGIATDRFFAADFADFHFSIVLRIVEKRHYMRIPEKGNFKVAHHVWIRKRVSPLHT